MQRDRNLIEVLAVNCQVNGVASEVGTTTVVSATAALRAIQRQSFDVLLTGNAVNDGPIWPFIQKLRMVRPKLQWWLVDHGINPDDERLARTLGMARLLATAPTAEWIASTLRRPPAVEHAVRSDRDVPAVSAVSG